MIRSQETPTYRDIFGIPPPEKYKAVQNLPSTLCLKALAMLTQRMGRTMFLNERQEIEVLRRFYSPHRGPEYDLVLSRLRQLRPAGRSVSLFNKYTCLQMMVRILKEGRVQSDPEADIVGPELLRYYLAIEEEIGVVDRAIVEEVSRTDEDDPLYFQKFTWPMTLKTYWLSRPKDIVLELCKLVYGLKHLMDNPAHTPYVEEYLKQIVSFPCFRASHNWRFQGHWVQG